MYKVGESVGFQYELDGGIINSFGLILAISASRKGYVLEEFGGRAIRWVHVDDVLETPTAAQDEPTLAELAAKVEQLAVKIDNKDAYHDKMVAEGNDYETRLDEVECHIRGHCAGLEALDQRVAAIEEDLDLDPLDAVADTSTTVRGDGLAGLTVRTGKLVDGLLTPGDEHPLGAYIEPDPDAARIEIQIEGEGDDAQVRVACNRPMASEVVRALANAFKDAIQA